MRPLKRQKTNNQRCRTQKLKKTVDGRNSKGCRRTGSVTWRTNGKQSSLTGDRKKIIVINENRHRELSKTIKLKKRSHYKHPRNRREKKGVRNFI